MAADEAAPAARGASPFTALELVAAEQLIHLSESSCSSGAALTTPRGAGRGLLRLPLPASAASAASSSTASPRSVNNGPAPAPAPVPVAAAEDEEEEDDDDEQEVGGRRRRNKCYRPIAEIYAAKPIGPRRRRAADRPRATDGAAKARK